MQLYLVQHGESRPKEEDPERSLSENGAARVRKMAARASALGVRVFEIWHSDKKRAIQTAVVFAAALGAPQREREGLAPNDDVGPLARELASRSDDLLVVGHLPHLARLASVLLTGREDPLVTFQYGGIVRLDRSDEGRWSLRWILPPEVVEGV
jgi:phosphohistidine phosphatase